MQKLLYYPNFEIRDEIFLKFALLYIDEVRPIIPKRAMEDLSQSMKMVLNYTNLINPYLPNYDNGLLASCAAIDYLESNIKDYNMKYMNKRRKSKDNILYFEKYSHEFWCYCIDNKLGIPCDDGIMLDEDTIYIYMSLLAEIISKEHEIDMITDEKKYAHAAFKKFTRTNREKTEQFKCLNNLIALCIPANIEDIPLERFIALRADNKFERARKNFVKELNKVLETKNEGLEQKELYDYFQCKNEIYGLLKDIAMICCTITVGVQLYKNTRAIDNLQLDFWGNTANMVVSLDVLAKNMYEAKEYLTRIEDKRQARKYLTMLNKRMTL